MSFVRRVCHELLLRKRESENKNVSKSGRKRKRVILFMSNPDKQKV